MIGEHARLMLTGGAIALTGVVAHLTTPARVMFFGLGALFVIIGAEPAMQHVARQRPTRAPKRPEPVSGSPFAAAKPQLALEAFSASRDVVRRVDTWKMIHDTEHAPAKPGRNHSRCPWCA